MNCPSENHNSPLVSIIVPNYNGKEVLQECINALLKVHFVQDQIEIIIVDNGSTDGSQEIVRQMPGVRLVALPRNEGFASAINLGVEESRGEFVALVNNDIELTPEWLRKIVAVMSGDAQIAVCTGKLLFRHRPHIINDLGDIILVNGAGLHRGLGTRDTGKAEIAYVGAASGAACLIRKDEFCSVGGFDDSYFAYFEDIDLGWRLWGSGRKVVCVPSAVAYHRWQWTTKKFGSEFKSYHDAKNSFATFLKNVDQRYLLEAFLLWVLRLLLDVLRRVKAKDALAIVGIVRSLRWCSGNLRPLLTKRKIVQLHKVVSDSELMKLGVLWRLPEVLAEVRRIRKLSL